MSGVWDHRSHESDTDRWARRNAQFCRLVSNSGFHRADTVYAFNGAALEIFELARRRGLRTVLDQTSAPWRWNAELLRVERERWPGWEDEPAEIDASGRISAREEAEWALADRIICGSMFARDRLVASGVSGDICAVVPYAGHAAVDRRSCDNAEIKERRDTLNILFVGTLQLRKGLPYLLAAVRKLSSNRIRTRLVGPSRLSAPAMRELKSVCDVVGPVPRSRIGKQYEWADVLVLPTLSEGSANVCYEAMASGLPVVTTPNAGSIIRHEENGLLVSIRESDDLAAALDRIAADPALRRRLGRAGAEAASGMSLAGYGKYLLNAMGCEAATGPAALAQ